jgi:hypothetical protein
MTWMEKRVSKSQIQWYLLEAAFYAKTFHACPDFEPLSPKFNVKNSWLYDVRACQSFDATNGILIINRFEMTHLKTLNNCAHSQSSEHES